MALQRRQARQFHHPREDRCGLEHVQHARRLRRPEPRRPQRPRGPRPAGPAVALQRHGVGHLQRCPGPDRHRLELVRRPVLTAPAPVTLSPGSPARG
ncbi:hypothetical protein SBRY_50190 [Actinacidiphila bryophytorum]|uniref:Uncharacterized protein n=1 Tax=Actinacidiphila bryophytorum TaxID=1436133 RepID=A0A9W4H4A7_9ACTN|nr:hypothetical protein SBRY_50190 [Actinacidiphila bryophytorum]